MAVLLCSMTTGLPERSRVSRSWVMLRSGDISFSVPLRMMVMALGVVN